MESVSAHGTHSPMRGALSSCRGTSGTAAALVKSRPKSLAVDADRVAQSFLSGQNPRTGREVDACLPELVFGDFDVEIGQPVTRREQFLLTCVFHQEDVDRRRRHLRRDAVPQSTE